MARIDGRVNVRMRLADVVNMVVGLNWFNEIKEVDVRLTPEQMLQLDRLGIRHRNLDKEAARN